MPAKRPTGARNETIRCENCGEYYSVTYKRCPFCEEREDRRYARRHRDDEYDEYEDEAYDDDLDEYDVRGSGKGGRRLVTNKRGGGYGRGPSPLQVIGVVLSLALIVAAIYIVITWVRPFIEKGKTGPVPEVTPTPVITVTPTPGASGSPAPTESGTPGGTDEPGTADPQPTPDTSTIPADQTATSFTLGKTDFTLSDEFPTYTFKPTFAPAGSKGTITWESSKPNVVSVDQNGSVRGLSKGNATITATMAGGYQQTCIVRSQVSGSGSAVTSEAPSTAPSVQPSQNSTSSALSISRTDFTLSSAGESWTLKVTGAGGTPQWSVKDSSIATVDANGKVTAVSKGRTTVTATVDGQTLECIVRCTW